MVFAAETSPLIQYYSKSKKLLEVEGEGSEDAIETRIIEALRKSSSKPGK